MSDPIPHPRPFGQWQQQPDAAQKRQSAELDSSLRLSDEQRQALAQSRRQAVENYQRKRSTFSRSSTPRWLLGTAVAALLAITIVPLLQNPSSPTTSAPKALLLAEEDIEFFESLDLIEWSLKHDLSNPEQTS